MIEKQLTIQNKLGLHARAAMKLLDTTTRFSANILFSMNGRDLDGKDIMCLLSLGAKKGTELCIKIEGDDESDAFLAIETLFNNKFDEAE